MFESHVETCPMLLDLVAILAECLGRLGWRVQWIITGEEPSGTPVECEEGEWKLDGVI